MRRYMNTKRYDIATEYIETNSGAEYEVRLRCEVYHEPNYGADADGNRGVPMDFAEDAEILEIQNTRTKRVIPIKRLEKIKGHDGEYILDKIYGYLDERGIDWEADEPDEPDYDMMREQKWERDHMDEMEADYDRGD